MQLCVFVSTKYKELILDDWATHRAAKPVVIVVWLPWNCSSSDCIFGQIVEGVVILILVVPLARSMPIVRASLRHQAELSTGRVSVFGAELVGREIEFCNSVGNDRGVVPRYAEVVVIHSVHRKVVVARARSSHRAADARYATRLRHHIRS